MAFWQVYLAKLLSLYYNVKIGAFLVWCMISYGPSTVLRVKERPNKPQILKQDVTDRFVKINVRKTLNKSCTSIKSSKLPFSGSHYSLRRVR